LEKELFQTIKSEIKSCEPKPVTLMVSFALLRFLNEGVTSYLWLGGFFVSLVISMGLLMKATQALPLGTAYAVWTGIGAVGTVVMGIIFFKEPVDFWRMFFIFTLIASIVGLKFVSN